MTLTGQGLDQPPATEAERARTRLLSMSSGERRRKIAGLLLERKLLLAALADPTADPRPPTGEEVGAYLSDGFPADFAAALAHFHSGAP